MRVGGLSRDDLLVRLRAAGVQLNAYAERLFADARFTTERDARLVAVRAVTIGGLGFPHGATWDELVTRAAREGLLPGPLELGPHLRLQWDAQPESASGASLTHGRAPPGSVSVASVGVSDSEDDPRGFYLRRIDGVPWLRAWVAPADHVWSPGDVVLFARGE